MLALENLYFKLKTFDIAGKVSQIAKIGYKDLLEKKISEKQCNDRCVY